MTASDEYFDRTAELHSIINKARAELDQLEPKKPYLVKLEEELLKQDEEWEAQGTFEENGARLCDIAVAALNKAYAMGNGAVVYREGTIAIATDFAVIMFDPEEDEWYSVERS